MIPFEALPDEREDYLVERYDLSYLGVARDILAFERPSPAADDPLVVAAPDFELGATPTAAGGPGRRARPDRGARLLVGGPLEFDPLERAFEEGNMVVDRLGRALDCKPSLLTGEKALEGRVKQTRSPLVLHLATHGTFLTEGHWCEGRDDPAEHRIGQARDPLLRSLVALAGANTAQRREATPDEAEDGLLTAQDVGTLDLSGTELAVLSACHTAVGEPTRGEGVLGLRRAFLHAGARTLVMTLWQTGGSDTFRLMTDFYRGLLKGKGIDFQGASFALRRLIESGTRNSNRFIYREIFVFFCYSLNPRR